jgi:lysophospholipase
MTLVSLARNPVPSAPTSDFVSTPDKIKLRFAHWQATRGPVRGTCVIAQGRSEYIEKYFEVVADLRRRGFAVVAFDWRGQGGSDRLLKQPRRGHVRHFDDYQTDLETILREVVVPHLPEPYLGLGHSLGGHILLRQAMTAKAAFARLVVTGPMIRVHDKQMPPGGTGLAKIACAAATVLGAASRFVPGGGPLPTEARPFEGNDLTSDPERFGRAAAIIAAEPALAVGAPTIGWMWAAFRSMAVLQAPDAPRAVRVPVLFVAAGADTVVSTTAVEEFALRTKLGSRVLIAGAKHEILMERDALRSRFWAAFDAYLGDVAAAAE